MKFGIVSGVKKVVLIFANREFREVIVLMHLCTVKNLN